MTTNPIPLYCSTPPPDDDFDNPQDLELEDDFEFDVPSAADDYKKNQVHAQSPDFSKDVKSNEMLSFTICDDEEENNSQTRTQKVEDDVSLDFRIEEIEADVARNINSAPEPEQEIVSNFSKSIDLNCHEEITKQSIENQDVFDLQSEEKCSESDFTKNMELKSEEQNEKKHLENQEKHPTHPNKLENPEDDEKDFSLRNQNNSISISSATTHCELQKSTDISTEDNNILENLNEEITFPSYIPNNSIPEVSNTPCNELEKVIENLSEDEFDDFESFASVPHNAIKTIVNTPIEPQAIQFEADFAQFNAFEPEDQVEDDDFDDFQDFTSAPAQPTQAIETFPQNIPLISNINEIIGPVLEMMFPQDSNQTKEIVDLQVLNKSSVLIKPVDSAEALNFQWNKSENRKMLLNSIGIDSRNVSHHDKWNPSMPRFAANLSAAPLEPMKKPVKTEVIPTPVDQVMKPQIVEKPVKLAEVPVVELAWTSSSIVSNQLDGAEETINSGKIEEIHTTQSGKSDDELPQQKLQQLSDPKISTELGQPISNSLYATTATNPTKQNITEGNIGVDFGLTNTSQSENPTAATNTTYSGTFKETHIFTPAKSESTNRSRTKSKSPIDFDFETAAAGIIIDEKVINKEYRDVEYKPPTPIVETSTPPVKSQATNILPIEDEFSEFQSVNLSQAKVPVNVQKVKDVESRTSTPSSLAEAEMILSPAVLLPQTVRIEKSNKPKIEWPEPGINPDELARFEQIFSKPKDETNVEDDEWSDFVSNTDSAPQFRPTPTTNTTTYQEDEWSDFVSSGPVSSQPQFNSAAWQNSNYNYNNPLSVYASTHSNFVENNNNVMMTQSQNYNSPQVSHQTQSTNLNKNQFLNYNKVAPSISLIPDLGFVAPPNVSSGRFLNNFQSANIPRK